MDEEIGPCRHWFLQAAKGLAGDEARQEREMWIVEIPGADARDGERRRRW